MAVPETFAFVAGGTVQAGGGVYLERAADRELVEHCRRGDFTYILTSRQMGKSSLMIRTAERLAAEGARPAIVDLTELGAQTTAEQWYKGFLFSVEDQLGLVTSASKWWDAHAELSIAHRFARYFREVVLAERKERIVVFVDEIDTTLRLDFTDDFFAAVRFLYQGRANEPELQRLSFVLIGVATPGDLIKDSARTPFNIGNRIELNDFTLDEAVPLSTHLPVPASLGRDLVGWILRWTGGHPYLTLRVVRSLAASPPAEWTDAAINARVSELFFSSQGENDSNLQFVRDMLTKKAFNREAVLRMYYDIRRGERVPDKDLDQVSAWLKLSGVVCRRDGLLEVRNAIYEQVFQKQWARDHLTLYVNWRRRLTRAALVLIVLIAMVTGPLALYGWVQKAEADRRRGEVEVQNAYLTKIAESLKVTSAKDKEEAVKALANAQRVLDDLQAYKEASGGKPSTNLVEQIRLAERTRDDLQAKLDQSLKANEYLRSENSRLQKAGGAAANPPAASGAPTADPATAQLVTVPNVVGLDQAIAMLAVRSNGLVVGRITRVSTTAAESTVLVQSPNPRTAVQRDTPVDLTIAVPAVKAGEHATGASPGQQGATASYTAEIGLSRIFVYHDSASPSADWSFEIFVDNNSVMKLPGAAYQDRKEPYPSSARATIRSITPGARIRIVGTRLKPSKPLTVEGAAVIPVAGDAFESPVSVAAKSGDPQDGLFLFVMRVTPGR